jgi:hypothetical protein
VPTSQPERSVVAAERSIVIHGHFYQPPRENPWLEVVEAEPTAAPAHDWNERIERECYRAVVAARVLGAEGRIARLVNTLEYISFNFGATLLEWMERRAPDTYAKILAADRASVARLGFGNAIAQPYHHAILPLSTRRDKVTEVRWGIVDFRRRFGRSPQGMWLPETAVDDETLDVLATEGIQFTILAPHQVANPSPDGSPLRYTTSHKHTIALCIYDGPISNGIAFAGLLNSGDDWIATMLATPDAARPPKLVSAATDGETYGHHHKFGEMALARLVTDLSERRGVRVENFASYLSRHPAVTPAKLVENTSWSCAHGIERWRSNCGCRVKEGTNQEWRAPLRKAIDALGVALWDIFEREGSRVFRDPAATRDAFGAVVGAGMDAIDQFIATELAAVGRSEEPRVAGRDPVPASPIAPATPGPFTPHALLDLTRHALRIFSSCAWFFDDIGGVEPLLTMQQVARAFELAGDARPSLELSFLETIATARSNDPSLGTGRDLFLSRAAPRVPPVARLAGSVAAARSLAPDDLRALDTGPVIDATIRDGWVDVTERRIRREHQFGATVVSLDGSNARVSIRERDARGDGGESAPLTLRLEELTEPQRDAIRAVMRHTLLTRVFSTEELAHFATDGTDVRNAVASELLAAVREIGDHPTVDARSRLIALLDLTEALGGHLTFDVQTAFYERWIAAPATKPWIDTWTMLARRFGFTGSRE